ncbi:hypothetical protein [Novosphingopyxis sp. YJ-S2-01]|uniref:hypothetical protein n=1 Tax=Novosphingopyxis sp. YJ-S2-01 TaxID=2794021 RepID=UPI0018DE1523|nr:hypothetical protein [Novosphingopyxis sp. YJ-S2-01]MBH9537501.1 hypothetical protein [Novosphingopyxis sp. YJ-S2-01]
MSDWWNRPHTPLDHGELQIPLRKRMGNIDAQLDRYKAEQARKDASEHRRIRTETRVTKDRVRDLLASLSDERVMQLAKPFGCRKPHTARAELLRISLGNLASFVRALEREVAA